MFNARKRSFAKDECDDHSQLVNGKKTKFEWYALFCYMSYKYFCSLCGIHTVVD